MTETEIEIEHRPWTKVVIHEVIQYKYEELVKLSSIGVPLSGLGHALRWAEGVLFRFSPFPPTEEVVKEQLKGVIHWSSVEWTLMEKYSDVIIINETNVKIPVIDCSCNDIMKAVAKYLKEAK